jgi:hypothetical protein
VRGAAPALLALLLAALLLAVPSFAVAQTCETVFSNYVASEGYHVIVWPPTFTTTKEGDFEGWTYEGRNVVSDTYDFQYLPAGGSEWLFQASAPTTTYTVTVSTTAVRALSFGSFDLLWCAAAGAAPTATPEPTATATPQPSVTPQPSPTVAAPVDDPAMVALATEVALMSGSFYTMTVEAPAVNAYLGGGIELIALLLVAQCMLMIVVVARGR